MGTVAAVGEAVEEFGPGDRVWSNSLGHDGRQGTFSEYVAAPVERLYRLPDGIDPAEAAPVLHAAGTVYIGLAREARLRPGETIVVGSASGAVGTATVIDKYAGDCHRQVDWAAPGGVDVWWDPSGSYDFDRSVPLLAQGARVIAMAGMQAAPRLPIGQLYTRDASVLGFAISNASAADLAEEAEAHRALEAGGVRGRILILP